MPPPEADRTGPRQEPGAGDQRLCPVSAHRFPPPQGHYRHSSKDQHRIEPQNCPRSSPLLKHAPLQPRAWAPDRVNLKHTGWQRYTGFQTQRLSSRRTTKTFLLHCSVLPRPLLAPRPPAPCLGFLLLLPACCTRTRTSHRGALLLRAFNWLSNSKATRDLVYGMTTSPQQHTGGRTEHTQGNGASRVHTDTRLPRHL